MRILLLTQYFHPEIGATQNRMMAFGRVLVEAGHDVTVLTEVPNHPHGVIPPEYRRGWLFEDRVEGMRIVRVWVWASPRKSYLRRLVFYFSFMVMALVAGIWRCPRPECVLATSPPIFAGLAGLALSRLKNARFVLDVRDLWPTAARSLGQLKRRSAYWIAKRLERLLYRGADLITVTTRAFAKTISEEMPDAVVRWLPNGADLQTYGRKRSVPQAFRKLGLERRFVVAFAGNLGLAQDLETILDTADLLRDHPDIVFLFLGSGPCEQKARELRDRRGLSNVLFHPQVPPKIAAGFLQASDVLLATLKPHPLFAGFLPSKIFDYMACGRPVVSNVPGETAEIIEKSGAGLQVDPGDAQGLARAVLMLEADRNTARRMGERGRRFAASRYNRIALARELPRWIESLN